MEDLVAVIPTPASAGSYLRAVNSAQKTDMPRTDIVVDDTYRNQRNGSGQPNYVAGKAEMGKYCIWSRKKLVAVHSRTAVHQAQGDYITFLWMMMKLRRVSWRR